MAGPRNRIRRQRTKARIKTQAETEGVLEVEAEAVIAAHSPGKSSPSSTVQRKIPLSKLNQSSAKEELRRIIDIRLLRRSLLGQIRGYYLDAISRLPTTDLNTTLARGLLIAGHCYGPLHPIDNIIVNSVWYRAAFPMRSTDRIDVAVINQSIISRVVQRSLDGLVAALRHHCPGLSYDDALWHLSLSGADLRTTAPSLFCQAESDVEAAIQAAAKAARHPKPAALALFASSVMPVGLILLEI
uniref:Uncharacterized protein n=1 Tax=Avena sativa TaxID=4498 RepID=A0ACD5XC81_AVESA